MRIARGAVDCVDCCEAIRELVHVERCDKHGSSGPQSPDRLRVFGCRSRLGIDGRTRSSRQPRHVEQILYAIGHPGKRPRIAAGGHHAIDKACFVSRPVRQKARHGDKRGAPLLKRRQAVANDLARAHLATAHLSGDLQNRGHLPPISFPPRMDRA